MAIGFGRGIGQERLGMLEHGQVSRKFGAAGEQRLCIGAQFLQSFKKFMENPLHLVL